MVKKPRRIFELDEIQGYCDQLDAALPYLTERGIDRITASINKLGSTSASNVYKFKSGEIHRADFRRISIPTVFGDQVISLTFRRDERSVRHWLEIYGDGIIERVRQDWFEQTKKQLDDKAILDKIFGPRYWKPPGVQESVWGADHLAYKSGDDLHYRRYDACLVTESTFDGLTGHSAGFLTVTLKPKRQFRIARLFQNVNCVYISAHNDTAGNSTALKLVEKLGGERVRIIELPDDFNDLNDMHVVGQLTPFLEKYPFHIKENLI